MNALQLRFEPVVIAFFLHPACAQHFLQKTHRAHFEDDFFFNDAAPTETYTTEDTLSLHDALPIFRRSVPPPSTSMSSDTRPMAIPATGRSEEHTSELQTPSVISYAVFCLKKK